MARLQLDSLRRVEELLASEVQGQVVPVQATGKVSRRRKFDGVSFLTLDIDHDNSSSPATGQRPGVTVQVVLTDGEHRVKDAAPLCTVGALVMVEGSARRNVDRSDCLDLEATDLTVMRLSPDPGAVERLLDAVSAGRVSRESALEALGGCSDAHFGDLLSLHASAPADEGGQRLKRHALVAAARNIAGLPAKRGRQRGPHLHKNDMDAMEAVSAVTTEFCPLKLRRFPTVALAKDGGALYSSCDSSDQDGGGSSTLHVPGGDSKAQSARGHMTRGEYLHGRKHPQISWLGSRLEMMLPGLCEEPRSLSTTSSTTEECASGRSASPLWHILDVGGGRGDLALSLATRFPFAALTVIDTNPSSLAAGESAAEALGLRSRLSFVRQDFAEFAASADGHTTPLGPFGPVRCLVALHCCGGLSDQALAFAARAKCPFLVVPCCFNKFPILPYPAWKGQHLEVVKELRVLKKASTLHLDALGAAEPLLDCRRDDDDDYSGGDDCDVATKQLLILERLAESDARPVSFKAMGLINTLRLKATQVALGGNDAQLKLGLEAFPKEYSLRNMVLVGAPCTRPDANPSGVCAHDEEN